jgi:hypothetical protein
MGDCATTPAETADFFLDRPDRVGQQAPTCFAADLSVLKASGRAASSKSGLVGNFVI